MYNCKKGRNDGVGGRLEGVQTSFEWVHQDGFGVLTILVLNESK